jgi:hypothetical protein
MGQHGRDRTGSSATRGDTPFDTERNELPIGDDEPMEGYAPAASGPGDPHARRPSGIGPAGPGSLAGRHDASPRAGFDGVDRRRQQAAGWEERDRRRLPYPYGPNP